MCARVICDSVPCLVIVDSRGDDGQCRPPQKSAVERQISFPPRLTWVCQPSDSVFSRNFKKAAEQSLPHWAGRVSAHNLAIAISASMFEVHLHSFAGFLSQVFGGWRKFYLQHK